MLRRCAALLATAILLLACACSKEEKQAEPVVSVQTAPVKRGTMQVVISSEAVLFPIQQSAITPKISAPVKQFFVQRGSRVHKGQLLATLENGDLLAAAHENKGELEQAQAQYESTTAAALPEELQKAELDVQAAKQALDAEQKLYDSRENLVRQGALPRKDLDQARVSLTQAKNQYQIALRHLNALQSVGKQQQTRAAAAQVQTAEGKYMGAQAQLRFSEIRSPIDGVVTERPLYPGEMASAGTPLLTVMDISKVIAKAHIPQQDAAMLKVGDPAEIAAPGADEKIPARLTVVSPATDPNSTTIEVWAQAANAGGTLHPGTTVQLSIEAKKISDALTVPASALLMSPEGETAVMIVTSDDHAHKQVVQVGAREADEVQIISGLQPGQRVVTTGVYGLPDNTRVRTESQPTSAEKAREPADKVR